MIKPAFLAALMPRVRLPPLAALRGRAAAIPTVGLPPPAGPTEAKHRPAPRAAAAHRAPPRGAGAHASPPRYRGGGRRRTGETDRPAGARGGARPGGRGSRAHGQRIPCRPGAYAPPVTTRLVTARISRSWGNMGRSWRRSRGWPAPWPRGRRGEGASVTPRSRRRAVGPSSYQPSTARPSTPVSTSPTIGLSRRWASTPSSTCRAPSCATVRP